MTTITTRDALALPTVTTPRGARIAAELFSGFVSLFASRPAAQPAAGTALADDVAYVRRLARSMQDVDPGFAADLYAAADRADLSR